MINRIHAEIEKRVKVGAFYGDFNGSANFTDSYDDIQTLCETVWKEFNGVGVQHISFSGSAFNELVDARMYADFKDDKKILEAVYFNARNDKDIKQYPFTKTGASKCVRDIVEFIRNKEESA